MRVRILKVRLSYDEGCLKVAKSQECYIGGHTLRVGIFLEYK